MLELSEFSTFKHVIDEWISEYLTNIRSYPPKSLVKPREIYNQLAPEMPKEGKPMNQILDTFKEVLIPGITHWQHPHFHAYFPANSSVESLLAEQLTSAIGAQCMIWDTSPAAAELEERVLEWLRDAMGIPKTFDGVIQDTASTATLVSILTAREWKTNFEANEKGVPPGLRVYCSAQTHSSIEKAVKIAGLGRQNLIKIQTDEHLSLRIDLLEAQIKADLDRGLTPCCIVSAFGTTGTVAIDPINEISLLAKQYDIWHHIDAAYAGTALLLSEYQSIINYHGRVDTFVFNPHKWMFTNFDCTVYFVDNKELLLRTFEILPEYLKTNTRGQVNDYRDWGIPLGRRFRALKLWFVLQSFGLKGIQTTLRNHIAWTRTFADWIEADSRLELLLPARFNLVCLAVKGYNISDQNIKTQMFLERINQSGKMYLSHTKIGDVYAIRLVFGQTYLNYQDMKNAYAYLVEYL